MPKEIQFGDYTLDPNKLPEPEIKSAPMSNTEMIAYYMIRCREISFPELSRMTELPDEEILDSVKTLRKQFDLQGNKKNGYKVSEDMDERIAMGDWITEQMENRVIKT